jgi:hypothetical protein
MKAAVMQEKDGGMMLYERYTSPTMAMVRPWGGMRTVGL